MTTRVGILTHSDEEKGLNRSDTTVTMPPELFEKVSYLMLDSSLRHAHNSSFTLLPKFLRWATTTSGSPIRRLLASSGKSYIVLEIDAQKDTLW